MSANRGELLANLDNAMRWAKQQQENQRRGQGSLFDAGGDAPIPPPVWKTAPDFDPMTKLAYERLALGAFVSSHPCTLLPQKHLDRRTHGCGDYGRMMQTPEGSVVVVLVSDLREMGWATFLSIEDETGGAEVTCYREEWEQYRWALEKHSIAAIKVRPRYDMNRSSLVVQRAHRLGVLPKVRLGG